MAAGGNDGSLRFDTAINIDGFEDGISTLSKAMDRLTKAVDRLSSNILSRFNGAGQALAETASSAEKTSDAVESVGNAADKSAAQVKSLREQMDAISIHDWHDNVVYTTEAARAPALTSLKSLNYDPKAMAEVFGKAAAEIHNYAEAVEQFGNQAGMAMNDLSQKSDEAKNVVMSTAIEATEKTKKSYVSLKDSVLNAFKGIPSAIGKIPAVAIQGLSKILENVKKAFSAATKVIVKFGKTLGNKLANKVKQAVSSLKGLGKSSGSVSKSILKLSNMFKLMLIRMAMRAAIQGAKEGLQNLAQYSDDANKSISALVSGNTKLKNSFATAFAPALNFVIPALKSIIELLSTGATYAGQFIAALSGKTIFAKAVDVEEDYAASLKDSNKELKEKEKATKKASFSFDDLIQTQEKSSESDDEYKPPTPEQMFETVEIDKEIQEFANKIKDMFKAGNWERLGDLVGEKINEAVQSFTEFINWNNVGAKITAFVTAFTALFNKLVSTIDWYAIGLMMGTGINTLVNTLYLLLTQIDWKMLGIALALGLNGIVHAVDWELFGRTIGAYFQAKISALYGFVTTVDWLAIGRAIGDSLNGMIRQINWEMLGLAFAAGLSGIFAIAGNLAKTFDWKEFGSSVAQSLSTFFQNFDWAGAGTAISDIVIGLLDALITVIIETDWWAFGDGVATALEHIDWTTVANRLFKAIGAALGGIAAFLGGLIGDGVEAAKEYFQDKIEECGGNVIAGIFKGIIDAVKGIGKWIHDNVFEPFIDGFKDAFGIHSPSTVMEDMGKYLWEGFCNGIKDFFSNPVTFIKDNITDPFVDSVKNLLGIHSPSTILAEIGSNTVAGFNQGIEKKQDTTQKTVQSWAKGVAGWFAEKLGISNSDSKESEDWANSIISGYNDTIRESYMKSQKVMEKWGESVKQWFWGNTNLDRNGGLYQSFYNMGKQINEGFANGTTDFSVLSQKAIKKWGKEIVRSAKAELDIHSPSKKAYSIAEYFVNGFNNGVSAMTKSSVSAAEKWLNGVTGVFDGVSLGLPVGINIPNAASYIPRLATGTVVPPRAGEFAAILGDNNRDTEIVSPVPAMKQAFKEAIEEMGGLGGGNQTLRADFIVDGTKFGQLVYNFNNKERQRVGVRLVTEG